MILTVNTSGQIDWAAQGVNRIADNIACLLKTRKYEVPFMRDMGISPEYIDSPTDEIKGALMSDIIEQINTYEPRANVLSVDIADIDSSGDLAIEVVIEI